MSRSVLSPEHQAQLHTLRQWARSQGKTPPSVLNAENKQALAQEPAAEQTQTQPSEPSGTPAPDISSEASE